MALKVHAWQPILQCRQSQLRAGHASLAFKPSVAINIGLLVIIGRSLSFLSYKYICVAAPPKFDYAVYCLL